MPAFAMAIINDSDEKFEMIYHYFRGGAGESNPPCWLTWRLISHSHLSTISPWGEGHQSSTRATPHFEKNNGYFGLNIADFFCFHFNIHSTYCCPRHDSCQDEHGFQP